MVAIMRMRGVGTVLIVAIISTIVLLSTRSGDIRDTRSLLDTRRSLLGLWDLALLRSRQVPPSSAIDRHSMDVIGRDADSGQTSNEEAPFAPFAPSGQPVAEPVTGETPSPVQDKEVPPTAPIAVAPVAQPIVAPAAPVETGDTTPTPSSGTVDASLAPAAPFAPFAPFPPIGPPVTARAEPRETRSPAETPALATAETRHSRDISPRHS